MPRVLGLALLVVALVTLMTPAVATARVSTASAAPSEDNEGNPAHVDPTTTPDWTSEPDWTTESAESASAPPLSTYVGPTVPAPTSDEPPAITLYGPEVLRISAKRPVLRLVVFSSGVGTVDAKLGAAALGARSLRTGTNSLRYTIGKKALRSLAPRGVALTMTSLSPSGDAGSTLTRRVTVSK